MKSRDSEAEAKKQVNARLPASVVEILRAVAYVDGKSSLQELLSPLIEDWANQQSKDPDVRRALQIRVERQARRRGEVTPLRGRRLKH